ncbi:MAG: hypothetical protein NT034_04910 [Candidatus Magasanikbacteria bacterium]|nr:hypothetical protein [Candidatus Magasanikbacteria bacterium]
MKKFLFWLLFALNLIYPLAIISNTLDGDFGWHLRFGQDIHTQSSFPYFDTYTYTKYHQPWTNHEWGGDWLLYQIYSHLGYFWINIILAIASAAAFWIIGKAFLKKTGVSFLIFTLICQMAVYHIFSPRLAMFSQLFAALIILIIEKYSSKARALYFIPFVLWLWSTIHGSWILGFIIINIYLGCALLPYMVGQKYQKYFNEEKKPLTFIYHLIGIQLLAAALICINPYGIKIWQEIFEYFGQNYYKAHISEWTPSYAYPVFPKILILQTVTLFLIAYGFIKQRVKFSHFTFFLAFFYAAMIYKRQAIFTALLSVPILEHTAIFVRGQTMALKFHKFLIKQKEKLYFVGIIISIFLIIFYSRQIHYTYDPWNDRTLNYNNAPPYEATKFLQSYTAGKPIKLFNEFSWGGFLNWMLPNALVYLDGRGSATWMYDAHTSMLERYIELKEQDDAVEQIEATGADYIMLRYPKFVISGTPSFVDTHLFGANFKEYFVNHEEKLKEKIDNSGRWKRIYSDQRANIWQKINPAP